jgi:pectinesterase
MSIMTELVVGRDCPTIQDALDRTPEDEPLRIVLPPGIYREKVLARKRNLSIEGSGMEKSVIVWDDGAYEMLPGGMKRGTFRTSTLCCFGDLLTLRNLSVRNEAGDGRTVGQAVAFYGDVRHISAESVSFWSHQDTLFLAPLPAKEREKNGFVGPGEHTPRLPVEAWFSHCHISGDIDFIFGGAEALFSFCTLTTLSRGGYVTAPSGKKGERGFVFDHCLFDNEDCMDETAFLMRPWREEGKASFLSCSYGRHIDRRGASPWPGHEADGYAFYEYHPQSEGAMEEGRSLPLDEREASSLVDSFHPASL